jgi:hypothetical protein
MNDTIKKANADIEAVSRTVFMIERATDEKALSEATSAALFEFANHTADLTAVLMRITRKVDEETARRLRGLDYPGLMRRRPKRTRGKSKEPVKV